MGRIVALSIALVAVFTTLTTVIVLSGRRAFPQAGSIVFEIGHRDYDLYSIRPNGSFGERMRLLFQPSYSFEDRYVTGVDCAPQGQSLIFWYIFLYRFDLQDEHLTRLVVGEGLSQRSVWSPDGGRIAYIDDLQSGTPREVFTINADGTAKTRVTANEFQETSLSWSSNGAQIAFTYKRLDAPTRNGLAIANLQAGTSTVLYESDTPINNVSWSPDGARIAFDSATDIYAINEDGQGLTRLTRSGGQNILPRWSPDGTLISYSARAFDGHYALYVMDADGGNPYLVFYDANEDDVFNRCWLTT